MSTGIFRFDPQSNPSSEYFVGLGQMTYNFLIARYAIVWLGQTEDPYFVTKQGAEDFKNTVPAFDALAEKRPEWKDIALRFDDLSKGYSYLLASTAASDAQSRNYLGSSDAGKVAEWTIELMADFVKEAQAISAVAGDLRRRRAA